MGRAPDSRTDVKLAEGGGLHGVAHFTSSERSATDAHLVIVTGWAKVATINVVSYRLRRSGPPHGGWLERV